MRLVLPALLLVVFAAAPALPQAAFSSSTQTASALAPSPSFAFAAAQQKPPRVFDSKFLLLTGIAAAATVADVVTTSNCLAASLSCQESNPLVGSRPSTGKLYGFAISTLGAQVAISALLRHHSPQSRSWMIPPIAAAAAHGTAAVLNQRRTAALTAGTN